jgi:hypothetical protein
MDLVEDEPP